MASSSLPHSRNKEHDAFSGIEPQEKPRKVEESSRLFDVFINHRGHVKQTVALPLYKSLTELGIHTFLDKEEKELGYSFVSTIKKAIHSAKAHIAIFSSGYAYSPWCLEELVLMSQSRAKIFPVFYGVEPADLRYIKGEYAKAFDEYQNKRRYMEKLAEWKKALHKVSLIAGHEISSDFSISDCQNIVSAVLKEVKGKKSLHVAKYPVGLDKLVKDFERQCWTNESDKQKSQMVGIFGMGGVGKTTLAKELFNRKQSQYTRACFLIDVREAYANSKFPSLQLKLLKDLFQQHGLDFHCREEGTSHIGDCIGRSNQSSFLLVLDDIDHVQQLDALLIMEMMSKSVDSLVIVTTRDVGVLINTGITAAFNVKGMDRDDARELFCQHAFGQSHPANDYHNLVNSFLNVCGGLPLSLQVLGSCVRGRDQDCWSFELKKVSKTLPRDILQRLKRSFDALDYEEQQIFMDIACFFVDELKSIAMSVWEASGWSAKHNLERLKNKCLVQDSIKEGYWARVGEDGSALRMHDHLRYLGREMANGLSRPRRLWHPQDLEYLKSKGSQNILVQTNGRCFHSILDEQTGYRITYFVGESDRSAKSATVLLWLQVEVELALTRLQPSIPSWIPLQNLRCLIIRNLRLKSLWQSHVQAPTQLKELQIYNTYWGEFSYILGMLNSLEKILIDGCPRLKTMSGLSDLKKLRELNISQCSSLEELSVVNLSCLEKLILHNCHGLKTVPGISDLKKLIELNIYRCFVLQELSVVNLSCLRKLILHNCDSLKTMLGISDLRKLVELNISGCPVSEQLRLVGLNSLKHITLDYVFEPKYLELVDCRNLETISGNLNLEKLVSINICDCPKLEGLPSLEGLRNLETLTIQTCGNLQTIQGIEELRALESLWLYDCPELEDLPCFGCQTCLEKITIGKCGKLQNISLPTTLVELSIEKCRGLKTLATSCDHRECLELQESSSAARLSCLKQINIRSCDSLQTIQGIEELRALESLRFFDCPELEELPCFGRQTCLEKITIAKCGKLQNISLPTTLVEFKIEECRRLKTVTTSCDHRECLELQELSSAVRLSCLKQITIQTCDNLQTIQGIEELRALEGLWLYDCPELEDLPCFGCQTCLEKITISRCGKLQNISLPTTLVEIWLYDCPELEELPCFGRQTCLEKITIAKCGKLQNISLPTTLVELSIEKCRGLKTLATSCDHRECLELQESSSAARLSCLKQINIWSCESLQTIQGIEELRALESLRFFDCPELEELPCFGRQTCLEKITIVRCGKLQNRSMVTNTRGTLNRRMQRTENIGDEL